MNMKWVVEVKLHAFLISAIDTRHQFRTPVALPSVRLYVEQGGVCGPRVGLGDETTLCPSLELNPDSPVPQPADGSLY